MRRSSPQVFDFKRHGDTRFGAPVQETRDERWKSTEGKMEKSFLTFAAVRLSSLFRLRHCR